MTTSTFDVVTSDHGPGYNRPQRMGRRLWLPMFLITLLAFPVAWVLGVVAADTVATAGATADLVDVARLRHLVPAFGFIGFTAVFSAISFAIARILGALRKGGGEVQEAIGGGVQTLRMPWTAKVFMAFMAMGMMTVLGAVVLHFVGRRRRRRRQRRSGARRVGRLAGGVPPPRHRCVPLRDSLRARHDHPRAALPGDPHP